MWPRLSDSTVSAKSFRGTSSSKVTSQPTLPPSSSEQGGGFRATSDTKSSISSSSNEQIRSEHLTQVSAPKERSGNTFTLRNSAYLQPWGEPHHAIKRKKMERSHNGLQIRWKRQLDGHYRSQNPAPSSPTLPPPSAQENNGGRKGPSLRSKL